MAQPFRFPKDPNANVAWNVDIIDSRKQAETVNGTRASNKPLKVKVVLSNHFYVNRDYNTSKFCMNRSAFIK